MTLVLGPADLRRALLDSLYALRATRAAIDTLNVYPVPDSDTGTNLVLTFEAVAHALERTGDTPAGVAHAVRSGSLMGARGNSGVILAQILRAWADAIETGPADVEDMARGFKRAVELAYEAVLEPAEGTVLSVARAASEASQGAHAGIGDQFAASARAAAVALRRTPEQLEPLARAGVVDAGGAGLTVILESFAAALGAPLPTSGVAPFLTARPRAGATAAGTGLCGEPSSTHAYEVQYVVRARDETIPPLRQLLGTIGDSVAVTGGDGLWRVHVHTDERERAVALGAAVGETADVETVSFAEQVSRAVAEDREPAEPARRGTEPRAPGERGVEVARPPGAASLIAVAVGRGVARLYSELGAVVIEADPTKPVAAEVLERAIASAPSDAVVLLPNNENVFGVAIDLAGRAGKDVTVLRTGDMAEGLAVAVAYGDARPLEDNLRDMRDVLARVRSGQVVASPVGLETPLGPVARGQSVGVAEGDLIEIGEDPVAVAATVARALAGGGGAVLTVLCGEGVDAVERERLATTLATLNPSVTVEIHDGGQSSHRYLLAAE